MHAVNDSPLGATPCGVFYVTQAKIACHKTTGFAQPPRAVANVVAESAATLACRMQNPPKQGIHVKILNIIFNDNVGQA